MRPHILALFVVLLVMNAPTVSLFAASPTPAEIAARAQQGDAEAQYRLGRMYQGGQGAPQDNVEAAKWYRKSAQQGYPPAERHLGSMYRGGYGGLPKDDAEARKWLSKAAEHGDNLAKLALLLEDNPLLRLVRGLPPGARDLVFFAIMGALCLIALAIAVLCIVVFWKTLKRVFRR